MEKKMTLEMAKGAKSPEELKELAASCGMELSDEEAAESFEKLQDGELPDDALEDVAGGFFFGHNFK